VIDGDSAIVEDLGSKNGTYLEGKRLEAPSSLTDGDRIRLGSVPLTVRVLAHARSTATKSRARR
jgi:pSer/pThr/pTyr-binding forkhead associated (FHA) protein